MPILSKPNTKTIISQVIPGLSVSSGRNLFAVTIFLVLLAGLLGSFGGSRHFTFKMPKAQASVHLESGVQEFTRSQKLYMLRSLKSNHDNIIKFQGASLRSIMNEPELVRTDFPTVVWQYRSEQCVLDVYFHSADGNADFSEVVHYEMRHRDYKSKADFSGKEATCMRSLLPSVMTPRLLSVSTIYKSVIN